MISRGKRIAIWGLAFKPDTDDIREAPALYMIEKLIELGATIKAYDPEAMSNVQTTIGNKIEYAIDPYDAAQNADALVVCTEWSVFRTPDFDVLAENLNNKVIFDGRNLYNPEKMKELGFYYKSIGRKTIS